MKAWNYPDFGCLVDLSQRDGVDVRPTLLRVITDTYLQSSAHAPDEERQYEELALRLLDETDIATRSAYARRIAHSRAVPRPIILQLARDMLDVAEPILKHSPVLTEADLEAVVRERGEVYAKFIATRGQPEQAEPERAIARAVPSTMESDDTDEAGPAPPMSEAEELCELFFAAGGAERRLILLHLDYASIEPSQPPAPLQRSDVWRLETSSLRHETDVVTRELQRALGISPALARRIVGDELGEPIVVAGKAMQLPADVLQRMILFLNPLVGQSVDRVYQLAALYNEMSVDAARRMVAIWQKAHPSSLRPVRHEALPWPRAAENARRALSELSHASAQQTLRRDIIHTR